MILHLDSVCFQINDINTPPDCHVEYEPVDEYKVERVVDSQVCGLFFIFILYVG
jgi:hypothetical protein